MSDKPTTVPQGTEPTDVKGKGKAPTEHGTEMSMDEEESSSEDEGVEAEEEAPEEDDEDNMEEIDTNNIVGRRTRGKNIDFQKAAADAGDDLDDDDEDDDEDFAAHEDADGDAMQE